MFVILTCILAFDHMKIVIAPDKFKQSLSSFEVCNAIEQGLRLASPAFGITALPLADGGDGLADVLAYYAPFQKQQEVVQDPLQRPVKATWLYAEKEKLAFVEMAQASGLHLLKPAEYNCAITTTYGTGQLIRAAVESGAEKVIIGIGGSATNDCGIGMAAALGYHFLDGRGEEVAPVGKNLLFIQSIDASATVNLQAISVQVACDVTNYLTGPEGATRVYGPQKGATPAMVEELEAGMQHFAAVVKKEIGIDLTTIKGGGAAGGMGAGCVAFLGAELVSGADLVFHYSNAERHIQQADLVITGEGKLDLQTWNGKLVDAVTRLSGRHHVPVIALCGTLALTAEQVKTNGLTSAFSIVNKPMSVEEAMQNAFDLLRDRACEIGRTLLWNLPDEIT